jgi:glycosyltransferase involved in cell wall biosynthesis
MSLSSITGRNLVLILGGIISDGRKAEARQGQKPRIDMVELESRFDVPAYGFDWLEDRSRENRLTSFLTRIYRNQCHLLALQSVLTLKDADVLYATGEDVGLPLAILLRLAHKKRPLLILRLEHPTYGRTRLRRWIYRTYYQLAMQRIDLTMCRTRSHVELLKSWGANEKKVTFVPETTDSAFFSPKSPATTLDSFQLPPRPYIVSAGLELRDYDTLIEAVDGLPVQVVIGAGSPWSKMGYERRTENLPANVSVSSFTPLQMRELYRGAEFVVVPVVPTLRACGMNVILEAWAMQKPVIASRTDGLTSYIVDGQTGLFAEPQNAEDLRKKIVYTLAHPEEAREWGMNGWERVTTELNLECYVNEIITAAANIPDEA